MCLVLRAIAEGPTDLQKALPLAASISLAAVCVKASDDKVTRNSAALVSAALAMLHAAWRRPTTDMSALANSTVEVAQLAAISKGSEPAVAKWAAALLAKFESGSHH